MLPGRKRALSGEGCVEDGVLRAPAGKPVRVSAEVTSTDADTREDDQFDLKNEATSGVGIRTARTRFSKCGSNA